VATRDPRQAVGSAASPGPQAIFDDMTHLDKMGKRRSLHGHAADHERPGGIIPMAVVDCKTEAFPPPRMNSFTFLSNCYCK
jgi:hypothetical protein